MLALVCLEFFVSGGAFVLGRSHVYLIVFQESLSAARLPCLRDCLSARLSACVRLPGCRAAWLPAWLPGCLAARLFRCLAA